MNYNNLGTINNGRALSFGLFHVTQNRSAEEKRLIRRAVFPLPGGYRLNKKDRRTLPNGLLSIGFSGASPCPEFLQEFWYDAGSQLESDKILQ